jgi:hypothetical protein
MARTKPEVAGKIAKAKEHPAVTRPKKLEKRVAKLEKEKEKKKGHQALDGKGEGMTHKETYDMNALCPCADCLNLKAPRQSRFPDDSDKYVMELHAQHQRMHAG